VPPLYPKRHTSELHIRKHDLYTDAYSDSNDNTYCNCYTYGNTYAYRYSHIHTDFDGDSNSYTYSDTKTVTDAKTSVNAEAAAYSAAPPVNYPYENGTHCSIRSVQSSRCAYLRSRLLDSCPDTFGTGFL
jgi:hypothetical protein